MACRSRPFASSVRPATLAVAREVENNQGTLRMLDTLGAPN